MNRRLRYVLFVLLGCMGLALSGARGQEAGAPARPKVGTPLAWVRFEDASFQHAGEPYLWLGHGSLELTIDVPPADDHALELLWGSKNDSRGAVATIGGREIPLRSGGYDGFRWLRVPLPEGLAGGKYEVTLRPGSEKPAFIAAVRLSGKPAGGPAPDLGKASHKIAYFSREPFAEMNAVWNSDPPAPATPLADKDKEAAFRQAARNALRANQAFFRSRLFIDGWLKQADPETGLIPRNLTNSRD